MVVRRQRMAGLAAGCALVAAIPLLVPHSASAKRLHRSQADGGTSEAADAASASVAPASAARAASKASPAESDDDKPSEPHLLFDFQNQASAADVQLVGAQAVLDGATVLRKESGDPDLQKQSLPVWDGVLTPGENHVDMKLWFKLVNPPLPYLVDEIFESDQSAKFTAVPGLTAVHAVAFTKSDITTPTKDRLRLELRVAGPDTSCPL